MTHPQRFEVDRLRLAALPFIAGHRLDDAGRYRYAAGCTMPTLYSSTYAAMTRHLLAEPCAEHERATWVAYLQTHQDDDGLFRDPVIFDQGWFKGDPLDCGRPHLTCHAVAALACLDAVAQKPLRWLEPWRDADALVRWLEARDWGARVAWTGNELMNVGVLATQNPRGGFGCGVHNPAAPFMSSACEDIDSIDPLCRMMQQTDYRRADIRAALTKAVDWVLTNQMPDGGFVFIRDQPFEYGHPQLRGAAGQGAMFPTWFRLLSLALIGKALPGHALGRVPWQFVRCPGMQFWTEEKIP